MVSIQAAFAGTSKGSLHGKNVGYFQLMEHGDTRCGGLSGRHGVRTVLKFKVIKLLREDQGK